MKGVNKNYKMTITCPVNDTIGICDTLDSTGAGLGVFLQYLQTVLPAFILVLAVIGGVVAIFYAIAHIIGGSIKHKMR